MSVLLGCQGLGFLTQGLGRGVGGWGGWGGGALSVQVTAVELHGRGLDSGLLALNNQNRALGRVIL